MRSLGKPHRRVTHRRADGQDRIRHAQGGNLGRIAGDAHGNDLSALRRRLRAHRARAGRADCESEFAARPVGYARKPVHQGTLRLAIHAGQKVSRESIETIFKELVSHDTAFEISGSAPDTQSARDSPRFCLACQPAELLDRYPDGRIAGHRPICSLDTDIFRTRGHHVDR